MIVVNLFGGPGAGKSTGAAYVFAKLKMAGVNAELVTEYAKDVVWDEAEIPLQNQAYVFGNQSYRISRLVGKVDVAVTDSPVLLSCHYGKNEPEVFKQTVLAKFNENANMNYIIQRVKKYNPIGRIHSEEESNQIGNELFSLLSKYGIPFTTLAGTQASYDAIVEEVLDALKEGGDTLGEKVQ